MDEERAEELLRQWLYDYHSTIDDNRNGFITDFLDSIFYDSAVSTYQFLQELKEEED